MSGRAFTSRAGAVVAVLGLLLAMIHWVPAPQYSELRVTVFQSGPAPPSYAFYAYDLDTGEFLYAIAMRACLASETTTDDSADARSIGENGHVVYRTLHWATFIEQWDLGGSAPPSVLDERVRLADQLYDGACVDRSRPGYTSPHIVYAHGGHFPQLGNQNALKFGPGSRVPASSLGPSGLRELRVGVIGDPFEVRAWVAVGGPSASCREVLPDGIYITSRTFGNWYLNGESGRWGLVCISFQYVGPEIPTVGDNAAVASPALVAG